MLSKKAVQAQLKNCKIREGSLYKQSKFLKEWRDRWVVLTMNYIFTFTKKDCIELTDAISLKDVVSYKSFVQKQEEQIPVGFKIRTIDDTFYFCAKSCIQKWSWIVSLERVMDFKYVGESSYNNIEYIKTRGFQSQLEFQNGGRIQKIPNFNEKQTKSADEAKKSVDSEADKIMEELRKQKEQFKKKQEQLNKKAQDIQEQRIKLLEQAKLAAKRSQQQAYRKSQQQAYRKSQQSTFVLDEPATKPEQPKEQIQKQIQEPKQQQIKQQQPKIQQPPQMKHSQSVDQAENSVAKLRKFYQEKAKQSSKQTVPKYQMKKKPKTQKQEFKYENRSKVITGLFDQLRIDNISAAHGFKVYLDFLVRVGADPSLGYSSFVIIQAKSHTNRQNFAASLLQYINLVTDYNITDTIARFFQILVFQAPDLLKQREHRNIKKKFQDYLGHISDEQKQQAILKSMYISHKIQKYNKSPELENELDNIIKSSKRQQTKNWAKKLRDDL